MILIWIGHNRLHHHLYSKLWISHKEQCPCGTGSQTTKHLLQSCPIYEPFKKGIWQDHTPVARKLYSSLVDLRCTATLTEETGVSIWRTRRRRRYTARLNKLKYPHSQMEQIKIPTQPDWRETLTETVNIPTQPDGTETLCPHKLQHTHTARLNWNSNIPTQNRLNWNSNIPTQNRLNRNSNIPTQNRLNWNSNIPTQNRLNRNSNIPTQNRLNRNSNIPTQNRNSNIPTQNRLNWNSNIPTQNRLNWNSNIPTQNRNSNIPTQSDWTETPTYPHRTDWTETPTYPHSQTEQKLYPHRTDWTETLS